MMPNCSKALSSPYIVSYNYEVGMPQCFTSIDHVMLSFKLHHDHDALQQIIRNVMEHRYNLNYV